MIILILGIGYMSLDNLCDTIKTQETMADEEATSAVVNVEQSAETTQQTEEPTQQPAEKATVNLAENSTNQVIITTPNTDAVATAEPVAKAVEEVKLVENKEPVTVITTNQIVDVEDAPTTDQAIKQITQEDKIITVTNDEGTESKFVPIVSKDEYEEQPSIKLVQVDEEQEGDITVEEEEVVEEEPVVEEEAEYVEEEPVVEEEVVEVVPIPAPKVIPAPVQKPLITHKRLNLPQRVYANPTSLLNNATARKLYLPNTKPVIASKPIAMKVAGRQGVVKQTPRPLPPITKEKPKATIVQPTLQLRGRQTQIQNKIAPRQLNISNNVQKTPAPALQLMRGKSKSPGPGLRPRPRSRSIPRPVNQNVQEAKRAELKKKLLVRRMPRTRNVEGFDNTACPCENKSYRTMEQFTETKANEDVQTKYINLLLDELKNRNGLEDHEEEDILDKLTQKDVEFEEIINTLEELLDQTPKKEKYVNDPEWWNDMKFSQLPKEAYKPMGEGQNNWDLSNRYTILNTEKWAPQFSTPAPKCINNTPCQVCPSMQASYPANLAEFDSSRYVTRSMAQ